MKDVFQSRRRCINGYYYSNLKVHNSISKRNYHMNGVEGIDIDVGNKIVGHVFYYHNHRVDRLRFVIYPSSSSTHFMYHL